jgi:hypothetical protein
MRTRAFGVLLALLGLSGALLVADGCTIVNGLTVPVDAGPAAAVDAAPADAAKDGGDGCNHALPPPPPPPTTVDGADIAPVVVVARQILLSTAMGAVPVGYDLDGVCTTDQATETCIGDKPHVDGPGGIDNNGGDLFNLVKTKTDVEQRINDGIAVGKTTLLFRLSNYNGTPNDPNIILSVYASPGLLDGSGQSITPTFVESEAWALDESQFTALSPDLPTTTSTGYVSNGVVVAFLASTSIGLSSSFSVNLKSAVLTAELDLTGAKPIMKGGIIAGRWAASDLLRVISRQRTSDGGKALCDDALNYGVAKAVICADLDIMVDRIADRSGLACNATSASIRFVGAPASLGAKRASVPDEPCPTFPLDSCRGDGG